MLQLRWLEQADGSDVKKLQWRESRIDWRGSELVSEWITVPTEYHVKESTVKVSSPLAKE